MATFSLNTLANTLSSYLNQPTKTSTLSYSLKPLNTSIITPQNIGTAIGAALGLAIPGEFGETPLLASIGRSLGGAIAARMLTNPNTGKAAEPSGITSPSSVSYRSLTESPFYAGPKVDFTTAAQTTPSSYVSNLGGYTAPQPSSTPPSKTSAQSLPVGGFTSTSSPIGNVSGGTTPGYVSGGIGISGYSAPVAGAAVPPPPVSVNTPTTPVGQFEAMVRELQKLNQGGYIPTPLGGATFYGPGYGMGQTLKRIREYQGLYNR
jgi:hypothetical protein